MSNKIETMKAIENKHNIYERFLNIALNRFKWENLPIGLDSEDLEMMLISKGQVMAFNHPILGLTILPCYGKLDYNIYNKPVAFEVYGYNFHDTVNIDDGVRIKNNSRCYSELEMLEIFSHRMNEIEQIQDVNLFQQSIPFIVAGDEKNKLTIKNLISSIKEHKLAIWIKKGLSLTSEDVLNTTSPFILDKLQDHKKAIENEFLTYLGINNANTDKKERLITSEVEANNEFINMNIDDMYDMRVRAVEEINKMFGSNIKVSKREVEQSELHTNNSEPSEE